MTKRQRELVEKCRENAQAFARGEAMPHVAPWKPGEYETLPSGMGRRMSEVARANIAEGSRRSWDRRLGRVSEPVAEPEPEGAEVVHRKSTRVGFHRAMRY